MKKLMIGLATIVASVLMMTNVHAETKGQGLCEVTANVLQMDGVKPDGKYSIENLKIIFNSLNLDTSNLNLATDKKYQIAYSCEQKNNLAMATLRLTAVDNGQATVLTWPLTKSYLLQ